VAQRLLEMDPHLNKVRARQTACCAHRPVCDACGAHWLQARFKLVPRAVTEERFWRNYFYRVSVIRVRCRAPDARCVDSCAHGGATMVALPACPWALTPPPPLTTTTTTTCVISRSAWVVHLTTVALSCVPSQDSYRMMLETAGPRGGPSAAPSLPSAADSGDGGDGGVAAPVAAAAAATPRAVADSDGGVAGGGAGAATASADAAADSALDRVAGADDSDVFASALEAALNDAEVDLNAAVDDTDDGLGTPPLHWCAAQCVHVV
jgi:hypothetical protein